MPCPLWCLVPAYGFLFKVRRLSVLSGVVSVQLTSIPSMPGPGIWGVLSYYVMHPF